MCSIEIFLIPPDPNLLSEIWMQSVFEQDTRDGDSGALSVFMRRWDVLDANHRCSDSIQRRWTS